MINPTAGPNLPVLLDPDEAVDLAHLLALIEDWLRHAGGDTTDDLVRFFDGPGNGRLAAAGLINALGCHAAALTRRSKEATR